MKAVFIMRCLGIDYGEKRIGLAYGDEVGVAYPLPAAVEHTVEARLAHIEETINTRKVDTLVVGYPYYMDGAISPKAREVDAFIEILESRFGLPVHRTDERLTSVAAEALGKKKRFKSVRQRRRERQSGQTDSRAAALFLQDWLDQIILPEMPEFAEDESI